MVRKSLLLGMMLALLNCKAAFAATQLLSVPQFDPIPWALNYLDHPIFQHHLTLDGKVYVVQIFNNNSSNTSVFVKFNGAYAPGSPVQIGDAIQFPVKKDGVLQIYSDKLDATHSASGTIQLQPSPSNE